MLTESNAVTSPIPREPRDLRVDPDTASGVATLPEYLYWIEWNGVRILVHDLARVTQEEGLRRIRGALEVLERNPEWRAPFLSWVEGAGPPSAEADPYIRRLSAVIEGFGTRQAVAGLSPLVYLAVRLINRLRRNKLMPFTTLAPALGFLAAR